MNFGTLSLLTLFVVFFVVTPAIAQPGSPNDLILQGVVRNIKRLPSDPTYVRFDVELDLKFVNQGKNPIIFLAPPQEAQAEVFQIEVISLALSKVQAENVNYSGVVWLLGMFSSIETSPQYREMVNRLDQPTPPADATRTLKPGGSWTWQTTIQLTIDSQTRTENVNRSERPSDLGWDVIGKIGTPLWMRLRYTVWSLNLQRVDRSFKTRLQKRWKNFGFLHTETEIDTRAIELKLNELR